MLGMRRGLPSSFIFVMPSLTGYGLEVTGFMAAEK